MILSDLLPRMIVTRLPTCPSSNGVKSRFRPALGSHPVNPSGKCKHAIYQRGWVGGNEW